MLAKQLMRFAKAAALAEGRVFEIFRLDAQAGGDVVADESEPRELFGCEDGSALGLVHKPFVEALAHGIGEGGEHGLLFQREADKRDEVGEAPGLRAAFHFSGSGDGEGIPEAVLGPRGVVVAEFLFQFLEHLLGETLFERAAVEDLEGVDLGFVLREIVAEGLDEAGGFRLRGVVEALLQHFVGRVDVEGLLDFLLEHFQCLAQSKLVEWRAGFRDEFLADGFQFFGRDFLG